jgi:hypothetical protein
MKRILFFTLSAFAVAALIGCSSSGVHYPLQPGEKITFESGERAAEFRRLSGEEYDPLNVRTGRVVEVRGVVILNSH